MSRTTTSPARRDKPMALTLGLREIHGNVTVTKTTLTAWFVMSPQRWSFSTDAQREGLIEAYGNRLAALTGHRVHMRVTTRPYPASRWAQALHENTQSPLPGWPEHLTAAQKRLHTATLADKVIYIGVDLSRQRSLGQRFTAGTRGCLGAMPEIAKRDRELRRLANIIAGPGMEGREARTDEIEWLCHRSIRMGLPEVLSLSASPDQPWDFEDTAALYEGVHYEHKPFAPTVQIHARYGTRVVSRHVTVLTVGRMPTLSLPQVGADPWMQHTDRLGFPVDWSATFDVLDGERARAATARKRLALRDQERHYDEHDIERPLDLARKGEHARRIEDETTEGDPVTAGRAWGWWRIAVSGATEEECMRRAQDVIDSYARHQRTDIKHPHGMGDAASQLRLVREFTPGEPLASTAFMRRLPVLYAAAAMPHVSATVGDRRGPLIGQTSANGEQAVMYDPHYAMEVLEVSGLVPVVGGLGSGKSGLISNLVHEEVMRGITTTVLDPSGPMANLVHLPEFKGHARHIDLVRGEEGLLNPYAVIADPVRDNYPTDEEYSEALRVKEMERKALTTDVAMGLLPASVVGMPQTPLRIMDAIRAVGGSRYSTMWEVVDALDALGDEHSISLANNLRDMAEMPQSRLFFANHAREQHQSTDTLLVMTMQGLTLPDRTIDRSLWSSSERVSVPLLHLASHYATQRAYGLDRQARKMVALDEAGMMGQWGSGRALFTNLGRDTRKWNICALIASQNPSDVLDMNVANFIGASFVGRIEDPDVARQALPLLRVAPDVGYEKVLGTLSPLLATPDGARRRGPREFIFRDPEGNVERMKVELSHKPHLLSGINTTANPMARAS